MYMLYMKCYALMVLRECCTRGSMYICCCIHDCTRGVLSMWCCVRLALCTRCAGGVMYM